MELNDEKTNAHLGLAVTDVDKRELRDNGVLLLIEDITDSVAREFIRDLSIISLHKPDKLHIRISSPGGSAEYGMGMIRMMRELAQTGVYITGEVYGYAMSMAFLILQACDERIMGKGDILMAHGITTHAHGDTANVDAEKKVMTDMKNYFASEIAGRNTSNIQKYHTEKFWRELLMSNTPHYYNAKEGVVMGLVDILR